MEDINLVISAKKASENAIVPFSGFRVGAALLSSDGRLFTGCNIENHSLSMSVCAEQVAFTNAISSGVREFEMANRECEFVTRPIEELLPMAFKHG